jgi:hypothetical protein
MDVVRRFDPEAAISFHDRFGIGWWLIMVSRPSLKALTAEDIDMRKGSLRYESHRDL